MTLRGRIAPTHSDVVAAYSKGDFIINEDSLLRVIITTRPVTHANVCKKKWGDNVIVLDYAALDEFFGPLAHRVLRRRKAPKSE